MAYIVAIDGPAGSGKGTVTEKKKKNWRTSVGFRWLQLLRPYQAQGAGQVHID